jgi:hypothetical protein
MDFGWEVDVTGSETCPMAGCDIDGLIIRVLLTENLLQVRYI